MSTNKSPTFNQRLRMLGFRVEYEDDTLTHGHLEFDIERDLIDAIIECRGDYRLLGLLAIWFKKHSDYVIVEKFFKYLSVNSKIERNDPILNFLVAIAVSCKRHKWKRWLMASKKKPVYPIDEEVLKSSIKMKGANEDLAPLGVLVPNGFLKTKEDNIFSTQELASVNKQFRNRLIFGANWRADIVTAIEAGVENPFRISKALGCGYQSCHRIMKEYKIAHLA